MKGDIQKQLASRNEAIKQRLGAAELRYDLASNQVDRATEDRRELRRGMPGPSFTPKELVRMAEIADRNRDADLLRFVHKIAIRELPVDREMASVIIGRTIMAGIEMSKAQDRLDQARQYISHRQVPIRDAEGRDHTVSIRDVQPRTLAEAITNRVTRPPEQRFDPTEVRRQAQEQLSEGEREVTRSLSYYNAINQIASDCCSKMGMRMEKTPATLSAEHIQEVKEYLPRMQDDYLKREFTRALPLAERELKEKESERSLSPQNPERDQQITGPGQQGSPISDLQRIEKDSYQIETALFAGGKMASCADRHRDASRHAIHERLPPNGDPCDFHF